jgi:hypothetical protein
LYIWQNILYGDLSSSSSKISASPQGKSSENNSTGGINSDFPHKGGVYGGSNDGTACWIGLLIVLEDLEVLGLA